MIDFVFYAGLSLLAMAFVMAIYKAAESAIRTASRDHDWSFVVFLGCLWIGLVLFGIAYVMEGK